MFEVRLQNKRTIPWDEYFEYVKSNRRPVKDVSEDILYCIDAEKFKDIEHKIDWVSFSYNFKNKYPDKLGLVLPFIRWDKVVDSPELSEDFIMEFYTYIDFSKLSSKVLTNRIIDMYFDEINWEEASRYKEISDENIEKFKDKLDWQQLLQHHNFSVDQVDKYFTYIGKELINSVKPITEALLRKYEEFIDWKYVLLCFEIPCDLIDKHLADFYDDEDTWGRIRKYSNLKEWFIMKYYDQLSYPSINITSNRTISKVLKNNNLSKKDKRSAGFNAFLQSK
jgi:hypothetical protein